MRYRCGWLALWAIAAGVGCAPGMDETDVASASRAEALFVGCERGVCTEEHLVEVEPGVRLFVVEKYSLASVLRRERRAVLMLPATLVTSVIWAADVEGSPEYDATERAAREGFFAYTLDWWGYGASDAPANGKEVDAERMLEHSGELVEWIRERRRVREVDLIGSSLGSAIAVALGGTRSPIDEHHIGRIVLTAHVYRTATPLAMETIFNPANEALLRSIPDGYVETAPEFYGLILAHADPAVHAYCDEVCPGRYAVGPTLEAFSLPVFDARFGRAPLLQVHGTADLIVDPADVDRFQREYHGRDRVLELEGGGHVPHWEAVKEEFWEGTFAFFERHGR